MSSTSEVRTLLVTGGSRGMGAGHGAPRRIAGLRRGDQLPLQRGRRPGRCRRRRSGGPTCAGRARRQRRSRGDRGPVSRNWTTTLGPLDVLVNSARDHRAAIAFRGHRLRADAAHFRRQRARADAVRARSGEAHVDPARRPGRRDRQRLLGLSPAGQPQRVRRLRGLQGRARDLHHRFRQGGRARGHPRQLRSSPATSTRKCTPAAASPIGWSARRTPFPWAVVVSPIEVARAILWLASEDASFTTGTFLDVTGGK